ncbi:MAG: hypothetical protein WAV28_02945, partial [Sedimentisphaerales bacterium]
MAHFGRIPRGDVGPYRVHLAEPAETEQLVGEGEISLAEPLGAGLIDAAIAFRSFHYGLAFRNGHAR